MAGFKGGHSLTSCPIWANLQGGHRSIPPDNIDKFQLNGGFLNRDSQWRKTAPVECPRCARDESLGADVDAVARHLPALRACQRIWRTHGNGARSAIPVAGLQPRIAHRCEKLLGEHRSIDPTGATGLTTPRLRHPGVAATTHCAHVRMGRIVSGHPDGDLVGMPIESLAGRIVSAGARFASQRRPGR